MQRPRDPESHSGVDEGFHNEIAHALEDDGSQEQKQHLHHREESALAESDAYD